ncbi:MAG: PQQ-binding-like beta-propeller repeat protein [Gemmataceae bacterium]|nr:PQQ-binding-like beta-propeller repeat protein [Gemmataceae bacterium]
MKLRAFDWCLTTSILLASTASALAENWPQWRGPSGNSISSETKLPTEFGPSKNLAWKVALPGMGGSTPIIWDQRLFLTAQDGDDLVVLCFDLTGKQLWKTKVGGGKKNFRKDEGNQASPSPCTDGKHVFAFFGTGDFACCDFEGRVVWNFNAQDRYGKFDILHGMHVTPLLDGDRLYLSLLHAASAWVVALDKATGKDVWKVARPTDGNFEGTHSYASPTMYRKGDTAYVVVHGADYTTAHNLKDGSEFWRLGDLNSKTKYDSTFRMVASPTVTSDLILIPTCKSGPFVALKPDGKGVIKAGSPFEQWRIPGGGGDVPNRTPDVPCPLIHDGLVYLVREYARDTGALFCVDLKTGKEVYHQKLPPVRYRATPVLADGKIYLVARDGVVTVIQPGREFKILATNKMGDEIAASPAISQGRIYLRGYQALYALSEGGK